MLRNFFIFYYIFKFFYQMNNNTNLPNILDSAFAKLSSHINNVRQQGQRQLIQIRPYKQYPYILLNYIQHINNQQYCLRASIEFKLWFSKYKNMEQFQVDSYNMVIESIKSQIINVYLVLPDKLSQQILQAIVSLAERDFPDRWTTLINELINKVNQNSANILRVLKVIRKVTQKYSYMLRSDPLYKQIIMVCDQSHDFLLKMTENVLEIIQNQSKNEENFFKILKQILKVFYNLNYQDLHPLFQDNIKKWMNILVYVMRINKTQQIVFKCKGQSLRCILLFASKYLQDVQSCIQQFSQEIWRLCSLTNQDPQFDKIVLNSLKYFKNLVVWTNMRDFFRNNLQQLLQTLIIPNISINKNVISMFQYQPTEFIDIYYQNSDINTRRSAAIELVKCIARNYDNYQQYLKGFLLQYKNCLDSTGRNLEQESILLSLVIDSSTIAYRSVDGVTQISINSQILVYIYLQIIKPYFASIYGWILKNDGQGMFIQNQYNLIHLSIQLRYIYYFRLYFPKQDLSLIVKFCSSLRTDNKTFKNIIYLVLQAFLDIKHGNYNLYKDMVPYFNQNSLQQFSYDILKTIYNNQKNQAQLNKYLTKTLYCLGKGLKQKLIKFSNQFMAILNSMLTKTERYDFKCAVQLFQTLACVIYWTLNQGGNISSIQGSIEDYFKKLLNQGSDLLNFTFQIYALIILLKKQVTPNYLIVYKSIMSSKNWSQSNNSLFSAYILYISSYFSRKPQFIINDKSNIQIILSQLVSINYYTYFITFLTQLYNIMGLQTFCSTGYMQIFIQGIGAFNSQDRINVLKLTILFFCQMMMKQDISKVIIFTNNISVNFIENLLCQGLPIISSIQARQQKKLLFFSICNMLSLNLFSSLDNWGIILNSLVQNTQRKFARFRSKAPQTIASITLLDNTFQKLAIFNLIKTDSKPPITDQEQYLVQSFNKGYNQLNGALNIGNYLSQVNQKQLTNLIKKYGG